MAAQESEYDNGFSDGVILALQIMHAAGDGGGTDYVELLKTAGREKVVERARDQGMMRLSGLSGYLRWQAAHQRNYGEQHAA